MPIEPRPAQLPESQAPLDRYTDGSFFDVTLVQMNAALISSGAYAPGPLIMQLALAATAQIMVETGRWDGAATNMTLAEAQARFKTMGLKK